MQGILLKCVLIHFKQFPGRLQTQKQVLFQFVVHQIVSMFYKHMDNHYLKVMLLMVMH